MNRRTITMLSIALDKVSSSPILSSYGTYIVSTISSKTEVFCASSFARSSSSSVGSSASMRASRSRSLPFF